MIFNKKLIIPLFIFLCLVVLIPKKIIYARIGSCNCEAVDANPPIEPISECRADPVLGRCDKGATKNGPDTGFKSQPYTDTVLTGYCLACNCKDEEQGKYYYYKKTSYAHGIFDNPNRCGAWLEDMLVAFGTPRNTDIYGMYWDTNVPSGCNIGTALCDTPCGGGGGGGGSGPPEQCNPAFSCSSQPFCELCPEVYMNHQCENIPCGWRVECLCGCECEGEDSPCEWMGGGFCQNDWQGGPSPTPSPTPTPWCTLDCPGQRPAGGYDSLNGPGLVVSYGSEALAPTVMPPNAEGTIDYYGYNGFNCMYFNNGLSSINCPTPTQPMGLTLSNSWSYPVRYHMLCGNQSHVYTAKVYGDNAFKESYGDLAPTPTPDPRPTPTDRPYPPGCDPSVTKEPFPTGEEDYDLGESPSGGSGSGYDGCSCSIKLVCQDRLMTPPSETGDNGEGGPCDINQCDFTVDSSHGEYPVYNEQTSFNVITNTGYDDFIIDYDDSTTDNHEGDEEYTFIKTYPNAGVYKVKLTCKNPGEHEKYCTRNVNVYCDNFPIATVTPTGSPTPTPISWYKIKDGSFIKKTPLTVNVPVSPCSFDPDDSGECSDTQPYSCFIMNNAGTLTTKGSIELGSGIVSKRDWTFAKSTYTLSSIYDPDIFLTYVREKKDVANLLLLSAAQSNKVNVIGGNQIIENNDDLKDKSIIVIDGNLTIELTGEFNPEKLSTAYIVNGTLNIGSGVTQLNGIFVANNINFATNPNPSNNPLKIVGNIISVNDTAVMNQRQRTDDNCYPSVFVVVDSSYYFDLLPFFNDVYYDWQEENPST